MADDNVQKNPQKEWERTLNFEKLNAGKQEEMGETSEEEIHEEEEEERQAAELEAEELEQRRTSAFSEISDEDVTTSPSDEKKARRVLDSVRLLAQQAFGEAKEAVKQVAKKVVWQGIKWLAGVIGEALVAAAPYILVGLVIIMIGVYINYLYENPGEIPKLGVTCATDLVKRAITGGDVNFDCFFP